MRISDWSSDVFSSDHVDAGFRAVVPDLIGVGRSDKPLGRSAYSYAAEVAWMRRWIEALDLRGIILACQDWGSLIGLRLVAEMPERFAGVALSNGEIGRASCRERVCQYV